MGWELNFDDFAVDRAVIGCSLTPFRTPPALAVWRCFLAFFFFFLPELEHIETDVLTVTTGVSVTVVLHIPAEKAQFEVHTESCQLHAAACDLAHF